MIDKISNDDMTEVSKQLLAKLAVVSGTAGVVTRIVEGETVLVVQYSPSAVLPKNKPFEINGYRIEYEKRQPIQPF